MKTLSTIMVLHLALLPWANGAPPPLPDGSEVEQSFEEALVVAPDPTKPTKREIILDGQIYDWSLTNVTWMIEKPMWKVQWCSNLLSNDWQTLSFTTDGTFVHNRPDGFYRVLKMSKPISLPPTHPPLRTPSIEPAFACTNRVPNTNSRFGGFRTVAK